MLLAGEGLPHTALGCHHRYLGGDPWTADRLGHVMAIDCDLLLTAGPGAELEIQALKQWGHRAGVGGIDPLVLDPPGEGPVHRTGIEIDQAKPLGKGPGHGAFACPSGAIDGNDWRAAHQHSVIDQAAGAAVDCCGQEGHARDHRKGLEALGLHQLHIVHNQSGRLQGSPHIPHQGFGQGHPGAAGLGRGRQGLWQGRGLLALRRAEVAVAGAPGQTLGLSHRGAPLHPDRQPQIGHHLAQDHQLLPILFAHHQPVGAHQVEQAHHHRGHPMEMARPASPTQHLLEPLGGVNGRQSRLPIGIHLLHPGSEESRDPRCLGQGGIGGQIPGITLVILCRTKLQRIHKHAGHHRRPLAHHGLSRSAKQLLMARVQGPHGGHKVHGPHHTLAPGCQLLAGLQQLHGGDARGQNKNPPARLADGLGMGFRCGEKRSGPKANPDH